MRIRSCSRERNARDSLAGVDDTKGYGLNDDGGERRQKRTWKGKAIMGVRYGRYSGGKEQMQGRRREEDSKVGRTLWAAPTRPTTSGHPPYPATSSREHPSHPSRLSSSETNSAGSVFDP